MELFLLHLFALYWQRKTNLCFAWILQKNMRKSKQIVSTVLVLDGMQIVLSKHTAIKIISKLAVTNKPNIFHAKPGLWRAMLRCYVSLLFVVEINNSVPFLNYLDWISFVINFDQKIHNNENKHMCIFFQFKTPY